jgi:hypothetical protein
MHPRLVFVHGIGKVRNVSVEQDRWTSALEDGIRKAGHSDAATTIRDSENIVFAHYADLFVTAQAQGEGDQSMNEVDGRFVLDFLAEAVAAQQDQRRALSESNAIRRAQSRLGPAEGVQGAGEPLRQMINIATTLTDIPYIRKVGQWLSGIDLLGQLSQVGRYLDRRPLKAIGGVGGTVETIDGAIRRRVHDMIGLGPTVVVAHSLGSIVALEALHERVADVPLLVTLGSPLAMRGVVLPRIQPQPLSVPEGVGRWLNVWDRDDLVAARPLIEKDFLPNDRGVLPVSERVDSDGGWVHPASKYLSHPGTAGPIAEVLAQHRSK